MTAKISMKKLNILGIRGLPASHGGFETFVEKLSPYLVEIGWEVVVYCQVNHRSVVDEENWNGVRLIKIPVSLSGPLGTMLYDWLTVLRASKDDGVILTLGYNTAAFNLIFRMKGKVNIINMDGLEWKRDKWGLIARIWLRINEYLGCKIANHLIADHPDIKNHLLKYADSNSISMIPYGAEFVDCANVDLLSKFGVLPRKYCLVVARWEPENSILDIVCAFSEAKRGYKLVVLGAHDLDGNQYHRSIVAAASDEVVFPGAVYEHSLVNALRFFTRIYIHGHKVGGTNPSLVEALGAGCAVVARDNVFNRWVAGVGAKYFSRQEELACIFRELLDDDTAIDGMRAKSLVRYHESFSWDNILSRYEMLLESYI